MITENATLNKCKSFIILNDKKEIFLYNNLEKEFDASVSITKHKIKEKIRKSSIPLDIKPKRIFNAVSQKIEFICPEYKIIKSKLTRNINKQLPPDNFIIFKNANLIIFQFPFQAKLFMKYIVDIFADDTFYICSLLEFILNNFCTTSFSILKNKEYVTYEMLFEEI
ncbi:hypothetical protein U3516DRAFT_744133 [Neocallimastix sp. 'constans']